STARGPSGYGEGQRWLGSAVVTTDATGHAAFDVILAASTALGEWITGTATGTDGTSEFSQAAEVQAVQVETSTNLTPSGSSPLYGVDTVTFTATVSAADAGAGVPAGDVEFYESGTLIGSGPLDGSGVAAFSTATLTDGPHSITAVYTGNPDFLRSMS